MSQLPWKPIRLVNLDEEIEQAFHSLISDPWGSSAAAASWQPEIDLFETPDSYILEADLPGVPTESIQIEVSENSLVISGQRGSSTVEQSAQGIRIERRKGHFVRRFLLEHSVLPDRMERTCHEGTLRIRLPKRKSPKQA